MFLRKTKTSNHAAPKSSDKKLLKKQALELIDKIAGFKKLGDNPTTHRQIVEDLYQQVVDEASLAQFNVYITDVLQPLLQKRQAQSAQAFQDFIGDTHPVVQQIAPRKLQTFVDTLKKGNLNAIPIDSAECAYIAYERNLITPEQTATLLERLSMRDCFDAKVVALPISAKEKDPDIKRILTFFLREKEETLPHFHSLAAELPASERIFLKVTIDTPKYLDEPNNKLSHFISIIVGLKVLYVDTANGKTTFVVPSVGIRDTIVKTMYGDHAKKLFPRLGEFSINDIAEGIRKHGRYSASYFPGVKNAALFHDISAHPFFQILHDEAHRVAVSSIPNPVYDAYLAAIDLIIKETRVQWSKEIWNGIDLDVADFLTLTTEERDATTPEAITKNFCRLLAARVGSRPEETALFTPSAHIDTTWLLLLDLYFNPKKWELYSIDAHYLDHDYATLYAFIKDNKELLENKNSIERVAILKAKYLGIWLPEYKEMRFEKTTNNYIQIVIDKKPIGCKKATYFKFKALIEELGSDQDLLDGLDQLSQFPSHVSEALRDGGSIQPLVYSRVLSVAQLIRLPLEAFTLLNNTTSLILLIQSLPWIFDHFAQYNQTTRNKLARFSKPLRMLGEFHKIQPILDQLPTMEQSVLAVLACTYIERLIEQNSNINFNDLLERLSAMPEGLLNELRDPNQTEQAFKLLDLILKLPDINSSILFKVIHNLSTGVEVVTALTQTNIQFLMLLTKTQPNFLEKLVALPPMLLTKMNESWSICLLFFKNPGLLDTIQKLSPQDLERLPLATAIHAIDKEPALLTKLIRPSDNVLASYASNTNAEIVVTQASKPGATRVEKIERISAYISNSFFQENAADNEQADKQRYKQLKMQPSS